MSKKYYLYIPGLESYYILIPDLQSLFADTQIIIKEITDSEARNKIQQEIHRHNYHTRAFNEARNKIQQQERRRHNYHTRAFNTVQQNMLRNRMNQRTKNK